MAKRIKRTRRGWLFPCGIEVTDRNIRLVLKRISVEERSLIPKKRTLLRMFKRAVGQNAATLYGSAFNKHTGKHVPAWWSLARGSFQPQFEKAFLGYQYGFMPRVMLDCALELTKAGEFRGARFPRPAHAFGSYVLSSLLNGWEPGSETRYDRLLEDKAGKIKTPVDLDRAYSGEDAASRMPRATKPSRVWEPGLVFDSESGLYVPPEMAGHDAVDVDAEE
jgi:hypothetical protein